MRTVLEEIKIFDSAAKLSAAFTAATTDIITSAAHGLSNEDLIQVSSATTLPAGLSASTDYYVRDVTTDTFKVSATMNGEAVNITDTGTGVHTFVLKGKKVLISDASTFVLNLHTAGSANFTIQVQVSSQEDVDFNATASATNRYELLQIVDGDSGTKYSGTTGYAFTGTDKDLSFELNTGGRRWMTVLVSGWSAGTLMAKASLYGN